MEQEITKFSFTQALREMDCPKCQQKAGEDCRQPKGRKQWPPHAERSKAYFDKIGPEEFDRRHTVKNDPVDFSKISGIVVLPSGDVIVRRREE